jgi:hypothetical protein
MGRSAHRSIKYLNALLWMISLNEAVFPASAPFSNGKQRGGNWLCKADFTFRRVNGPAPQA